MDFLEPIFEYSPIIGMSLVVLIGAIYATYKLTILYSRFTKAESSILQIDKDVRSVGAKIDANSQNLTSIATSIGTITRNSEVNSKRLVSVVNYIVHNNESASHEMFKAHSPMQLTDLGKAIYNHYQASEIFVLFKDEIIKELEIESYGNAMDMQNAANEKLLFISSHESFDSLKNRVFNQPVYKREDDDSEHNISMNLLLKMIAIEIRNEYLSIHPEMKDT